MSYDVFIANPRRTINNNVGNSAYQQLWRRIMKIIVIRHFGYGFQNSDRAVLLATGIMHHIVLLK
jgi:hypothetical protein